MPVKGATTRLNPVRLQTIPHLRVRRPNQHEQNPCVTVMSSMLSMFCPWIAAIAVDICVSWTGLTGSQAAGRLLDTRRRDVLLLSNS